MGSEYYLKTPLGEASYWMSKPSGESVYRIIHADGYVLFTNSIKTIQMRLQPNDTQPSRQMKGKPLSLHHSVQLSRLSDNEP